MTIAAAALVGVWIMVFGFLLAGVTAEADDRRREAPPPLPIVLPIEQKKTVFNELGSVTAKKNWTWEVVNANQVPREYLCIKPAALNVVLFLSLSELQQCRI